MKITDLYTKEELEQIRKAYEAYKKDPWVIKYTKMCKKFLRNQKGNKYTVPKK